MKEIGGYIELDTYTLPILHKKAIALNCGRNCLAYLFETKSIKKICLPYYLCDSVKDICKKYDVSTRYYHIQTDFTPVEMNLEKDEWFYVVNYFGQIQNITLQKLVEKYGRVIIDQAQAYFDEPVQGAQTIYTCRKFFGVPDGAFLYTEKQLETPLPVDRSYHRMNFLLGRFEDSASMFYTEYVDNNKLFNNESIKQMSKLTKNLLHGIDYARVKKIRNSNFSYLHERLKVLNQLVVKPVEGAFMYPFLIDNADMVRKELIKNKIYIPLLWSNVLKDTEKNSQEYHFAKNILPLPCDQRYGKDEMQYLIGRIRACII